MREYQFVHMEFCNFSNRHSLDDGFPHLKLEFLANQNFNRLFELVAVVNFFEFSRLFRHNSCSVVKFHL